MLRLGSVCIRERKSAAELDFPGIRRMFNDRTRSRQFLDEEWIVLDWKICERLRLFVKTKTSLEAPQMKCEKWSKTKYNARNFL